MNAAGMHPLWQSSPWLELIGWTLLHFLWQGALAAGALAASLAVLRGRSPRTRYLVCVAWAAVAAVLPLITLLTLPLPAKTQSIPSVASGASAPPAAGQPLSRPLAGSVSAPAPMFTDGRPEPAAPASPATAFPWHARATGKIRAVCGALIESARPLLPWCAAAWVAGVAILSLRLLAGWTQVQRLCRQGAAPADPAWQARLDTLARRLGVRRAVRLLESVLAEVPAVVGWLRPVILLPVGVLAGLSTAQVEMILAHELAHIRRQDYLINLGLTLFETLGFYHPAVWWIAARVRLEREHACDDLAVSASGGDRLGYARALATLEEMRGPAGGLVLAATSGGRGVLLARVRRLLGGAPERRVRSGRATWWLAGVIALAITFALTLGGVPHPARAQDPARIDHDGTTEIALTAKFSPRPAAPDGPINPRDLAGHVVDAQGKPVEGAAVTLNGAYPEMAPATTNAQGGFRFADFGDRNYIALSVVKTGFGTRLLTDLAVGRDFTVRLDDATRLRGRFLKPDGTPAGPATIVLFANKTTHRPNMDVSGFRLDRHTDEQGAYDLPVEPGEYRIEITADNGNLLARHEKFAVPAERVTALPEALQPGVTLRIRTVDSATGQPAPGARFYVQEHKGSYMIGPRPGSERQTDAQGFAQWDHLAPGPIFLDVNQDPAYARFWSTDPREHQHMIAPAKPHPIGDVGTGGSLYIDVVPGREADPVVIQTERGVKVSGRVLDPQDKPVDGAAVHVLVLDPGDGATYGLTGFQAQAVSTADGTFHACIPAGNGGITRLVAEKSDSGTLGNGHGDPFPSAPGDAREVTIHLTAGGWIEGSVVDAQGKPLAEAPVAASATDQLDGYGNHIGPRTDAQGHFRIGPLRPAEYEVRARGANWDWDHEEPSEERRRIMVVPGGVVQTGPLHFDPAGWTAPPPTAAPLPAASPSPIVAPMPKPAAEIAPAAPPPPSTPSAPAIEMLTARIKVVDEKGQPIAGATVTPDGLRLRGDSGGHYSWIPSRHGTPMPALTDANGIAAVSYPRYTEADEKLATGAISFRVEDEGYCAVRPTNYAVVDDPAKAEPVVLRPGAALRISGHLPGSAEAVPVYPLLSDPKYNALSSSAWKDAGGNALETTRLPPGRSYVRLTHASANGALFFSDTKLLAAAAGNTYTLDLELKPGVRVEGRLDASVPRPVRGGRVVIYAYATAPESDANRITWSSWRDVAADGTFVFEALPPGELAATALCEGYASVSLPETNFGGSLHIPQHFTLRNGETTRAEIKMEAAAACEVQVRDAAGAPVSGARVGLAPNVQWVPGLTSIFCFAYFKEEEAVSRWRDYQPLADWFEHQPYRAVTDARGIATMRNLPALRQVGFGVSDDRYESFPPHTTFVPRGRQAASVNLVSGETAAVSAQLDKKGTHPPAAEAAEETPTPTPAAEHVPKPRGGSAPEPPATPAPGPRGESSADIALAVRPLPDAPDVFSGRVADPDGKPLAGVLVDAWTWCPGTEASTDADGKFQIKGLEPKRRIEVRFSKEGFTPRLVVRQPLGALEQPLALNSQTYFEGTVTGPDGLPAPDAWIRANQGPKNADGVYIGTIWTETHADARGHYRLYAQDDRYDIQVTTKEGAAARLPDTDLADGQTRRLDIALQAGVVFRARVVDSQSGAPVAGARLSNWEHPGVEGISGPDGTLEIRGLLPGKFEWSVAADGCTRWWSEQCVSEWSRFQREFRPGTHWQRNFDRLDFDLQPGMMPVTITLERGVRIRGRALDPDGKPVAGATVAPAHTGTGNSITGDTRFSVETRGDGAFDLLLPASKEAEYNLEVHDGKYGEWRQWANGVLPPIRTRPGQQIDGVEIRLSRPGMARGRVLDAQGRPSVGLDVRAQAADLRENRYYDPKVTTDREGRFELKLLRPGRQTIQVEPFSFNAPGSSSQTVEIAEGRVSEEIELHEPNVGSVRGRPATGAPGP